MTRGCSIVLPHPLWDSIGGTPPCYTDLVPTSHNRIAVTKDSKLAEALDRAAALASPGTPTASLVHDLAIRGAEALLAAHRDDARAIERLIRRSTSANPGYDGDILADLDGLAWGQP